MDLMMKARIQQKLMEVEGREARLANTTDDVGRICLAEAIIVDLKYFLRELIEQSMEVRTEKPDIQRTGGNLYIFLKLLGSRPYDIALYNPSEKPIVLERIPPKGIFVPLPPNCVVETFDGSLTDGGCEYLVIPEDYEIVERPGFPTPTWWVDKTRG